MALCRTCQTISILKREGTWCSISKSFIAEHIRDKITVFLIVRLRYLVQLKRSQGLKQEWSFSCTGQLTGQKIHHWSYLVLLKSLAITDIIINFSVLPVEVVSMTLPLCYCQCIRYQWALWITKSICCLICHSCYNKPNWLHLTGQVCSDILCSQRHITINLPNIGSYVMLNCQLFNFLYLYTPL